MLITILTTLLIGQAQMPTAHPSTWDGVPGSDTIRTDAETGEIIYPMGQQPANALALRCVFGRSNVRCPKPAEPAATETSGSTDRWGTGGASVFDEFGFAIKDADVMTMAERMPLEEEPEPQVIGPLKPDASSGRLGFATGQINESDAGPEPEAEPRPQERSGCRREEHRSQDGSSFGVQIVCGSGDQRLLNGVMDALRPSDR